MKDFSKFIIRHALLNKFNWQIKDIIDIIINA